MSFIWRVSLNNNRKKSDKYLFYEALDRRLPKTHPYCPTVQTILRKEGGGYAGELRVDRELSEARLFESYKVMKSLLVGNEASYCQIDLLVIYSKFILIIEVKNIPGLLSYDQETHQLTRRRDNDPIESMGDPVNQLLRHERFVRTLLVQHQMLIPVHSMIIFSNPASILDKPFPASCLAIHVSGLYQALEKLHQLYADQSIPHFDTRKIRTLFVLNQPEFSLNKPTHIPINVFSNLTIGVLCPKCDMTKLNYKSKYWHCPICRFKCDKVHLKTLQEYRILFSEELTTSEWMNFTGINSISTTKRILNESNLVKIGRNKNRKWQIHKTFLI